MNNTVSEMMMLNVVYSDRNGFSLLSYIKGMHVVECGIFNHCKPNNIENNFYSDLLKIYIVSLWMEQNLVISF